MATVTHTRKKRGTRKSSSKTPEVRNLFQLAKESWEVIAPFWPLENLIAVNPLQGLESVSIEEALVKSGIYFRQVDLPKSMEAINRETIKWLQAYFDKGQATIAMPHKNLGLYSAWKRLAFYDSRLHKNRKDTIDWIKSLPNSPNQALALCLSLLEIPKEQTKNFLRLLLVSMPGWAGYVKYHAEWSESDTKDFHLGIQIDYLALRVIITYLLWPEAVYMLRWHEQTLLKPETQKHFLQHIEQYEENYRIPLLKKIKKQSIAEDNNIPSAQLVFCIDVRSEGFRRSIEASGNYETFGFAGFFGVPVRIRDSLSGESYTSCPVLLSPKHEVTRSPCCLNSTQQSYEHLVTISKAYQSVKYTFTTPFAMVEGLGLAAGLWTGLRTFAPNFASKLKKIARNFIHRPSRVALSIDDIPFEDQCIYAEKSLHMIGLTDHFAPLVVFCGHGSTTENNGYASALDCGACGGRHGENNARILASILNQSRVRMYLAKRGICIPKSTQFVGAKHDTTTDEVVLYDTESSDITQGLEEDLEKARQVNSRERLKGIRQPRRYSKAYKQAKKHSQDWAQVRPEWGLAKNSAFIVAPRSLTRSLNLEGRCFLHSYDYVQDVDGKSLETILTAPMVVAQWINAQYLLSTLDNVSYGGGSKVTQNITGKIGMMQGNASDLMTGLPLQSVCSTDRKQYHEPQRLMTIVYAPLSIFDSIIEAQSILKKLFGNGWVQLVCIEPKSHDIHFLQRDFTWKKMH